MYSSFYTIEQFGPLLLLVVFWGGGLYNILNWQLAKKYLESKGFVFNTQLILLGATIWQIGGATLAAFPSTAEYGCLLLIIFTLLSSFLFYQFWRMSGVERYINFIFFLSNMGLIGGLLLLLGRIYVFKFPFDLKFIAPVY